MTNTLNITVLVDISKSTKKHEKIKTNVKNIVCTYPTGREPAKGLMSTVKGTTSLINCCSGQKALSLIQTKVDGDFIYYLSPLTQEEIANRIIKAEADAFILFNKRIEKKENKKE